MHDWHLADEILKTILDYAEKTKLKEIKEIKLELGKILEHNEYILPENLEFNLKLLGEKTIIKDAEIKIKDTRGNKWKLVYIKGEK